MVSLARVLVDDTIRMVQLMVSLEGVQLMIALGWCPIECILAFGCPIEDFRWIVQLVISLGWRPIDAFLRMVSNWCLP